MATRYVGSIGTKEVDFVATKGYRTIYIQSTYLLIDEQTVQREYAPLESIRDNYEKLVVSLDDVVLPSKGGIRHIQAWNPRRNTEVMVLITIIKTITILLFYESQLFQCAKYPGFTPFFHLCFIP